MIKPTGIKTYYRLTKPGIIYGNTLTAAAGFLLASKNNLPFWRLVEFLAGLCLVIASAGVFNNYIDREIDKKMSRTQNRALATGRLSSTKALIFGGFLAIPGLVILGSLTNWLTFSIVLAALFLYVIVYGAAKRRTIHSTLIGTVPGAAPPLAGYVAATGHLDTAALSLFLILVFWQMAHFYAIGMYRYKDYEAADLPILPVIKGSAIARRYILVYIVAFALAAAALTAFGYTGYIYLAGVLSLGWFWLWRGLKNYSLDNLAWGRRMFLASLITNLGICVLLAVGARLP